jgi:hypothetical protein
LSGNNGLKNSTYLGLTKLYNIFDLTKLFLEKMQFSLKKIHLISFFEYFFNFAIKNSLFQPILLSNE